MFSARISIASLLLFLNVNAPAFPTLLNDIEFLFSKVFLLEIFMIVFYPDFGLLERFLI